MRTHPTRRLALLRAAGLLTAATFRPGSLLEAAERARASGLRAPLQEMVHRTIPSSGEEIPIIGMGTWQTFDA